MIQKRLPGTTEEIRKFRPGGAATEAATEERLGVTHSRSELRKRTNDLETGL